MSISASQPSTPSQHVKQRIPTQSSTLPQHIVSSASQPSTFPQSVEQCIPAQHFATAARCRSTCRILPWCFLACSSLFARSLFSLRCFRAVLLLFCYTFFGLCIDNMDNDNMDNDIMDNMATWTETWSTKFCTMTTWAMAAWECQSEDNHDNMDKQSLAAAQ